MRTSTTEEKLMHLNNKEKGGTNFNKMHGYLVKYYLHWASLMAQWLKNPPAMETQVRFLGKEVSQEKEMATHSSILA